MPFHLGPLELGIILLIVIALFGAGKLASLGGAFGRAVHDFRKTVGDDDVAPGGASVAEADKSNEG